MNIQFKIQNKLFAPIIFLARRFEQMRITRALNAVYGPGGEDGSLDPEIEALQYETLKKSEW
jgi:hypothetical protein